MVTLEPAPCSLVLDMQLLGQFQYGCRFLRPFIFVFNVEFGRRSQDHHAFYLQYGPHPDWRRL